MKLIKTKCCKAETWSSWRIIDNKVITNQNCIECNKPIFEDIYFKRFKRIRSLSDSISIYETIKDSVGYSRIYKVSCKRSNHIFVIPNSGGNTYISMRMSIKYTLDEFLNTFVEI